MNHPNDAATSTFFQQPASPLKTDAPARKAKKEHIKELTHLWADSDPPNKEMRGAELTAWRNQRREQLAQLATVLFASTWLIDSGRGFQMLWKLEKPLPVNGASGQQTLFVEKLNRGLAKAYDADMACCNIDRILRLPGTINTKPEAEGRRVEVIWHDPSRVYAASKFVPGKAEADEPESAHRDYTQDRGTDQGARSRGWKPEDGPEKLDLSPYQTTLTRGHIIETVRTGTYLEADGRPHKFGSDSSGAAYWVVARLVAINTDRDTIRALMLHPGFAIHEHFRKMKAAQARRKVDDFIRDAEKDPRTGTGTRILSRQDHDGRAAAFLQEEMPHYQRWRGDHYGYEDGYQGMTDEAIEAAVGHFLGTAQCIAKSGKMEPLHPDSKLIHETVAAMQRARFLPEKSEPPFWIVSKKGEPRPAALIPFRNGVFDVDAWEFREGGDPNLFCIGTRPYDYEPKAAVPKSTINRLLEMYGGEDDQLALWWQWTGYLFLSDRSVMNLQKGAMGVGAPRSGKDTQKRIWEMLEAPCAAVSPTLESLGDRFGMNQLRGKRLAIVSELHTDNRKELTSIVANIKNLIGGHTFTFDRKYLKDPWTGPLYAKLVILANEVPALRDLSGALATRFIGFRMRQSFLGREIDRLFEDEIAPERSGIARHALEEGLKPLLKARRFSSSAAHLELFDELKRRSSTLQEFIEDQLEFAPGEHVWKENVYSAYVGCMRRLNLPYPNDAHFARQFTTVVQGRVIAGRPRDATGKQRNAWMGLRFKTAELAAAAEAAVKQGGDPDGLPF
jgi:putative DNA primase/helicase